jgi:hypothetical protein
VMTATKPAMSNSSAAAVDEEAEEREGPKEVEVVAILFTGCCWWLRGDDKELFVSHTEPSGVTFPSRS